MSPSLASRKKSKPFVTQMMAVDSIIPYWRNPRRITDDAVNALIASIERFGYQQPIVVDTKNVIIIGHSRYAALRRMGVEQVPVRVIKDLSEDKIKQLRVLDNRTKDFSSWNFDDLTAELSEMDADLMRSFFPEVGALADPGADVDATDPVPGKWDVPETAAEFVCPSCFHTWTMDVSVEQVKTGKLEVL